MRFNVYATRTESIDALMVQPGTFGKSHLLKMAAGTLTISLPAAPARDASRGSKTSDPNNPVHTWYSVGVVLLRAELDDAVVFEGTEEGFNSPAIDRHTSSTKACEAAETILNDGFDLWKRTIRWTGMAPNIGIDEVETRHSITYGRGFKMFRVGDDRLFRNHGGKVTSHGRGRVSIEAWQSAEQAFAGNELPPVWFDFLHEAIRMNTVGNYRAAVVNSAIAAETAIRAAFRAGLPNIRSAPANQILDKAAAQGLLGNWDEIASVNDAEAKKHGKSEVHKLFEIRNHLMHSGLRDYVKLKDISKLLPKITCFVTEADALVCKLSQLPIRIFPAD